MTGGVLLLTNNYSPKNQSRTTSVEERFWQIGESDSGILVVIFTVRGTSRTEIYRLISARKANKRERALYEINKRIPI